MEKNKAQNALIMNKQNKLLEIGVNLIPYMTKSSDVIFYEEGSLQENDVIIFVDATNRKDAGFCTKILEKFQIK